jgi:pseudo-rSAM protein
MKSISYYWVYFEPYTFIFKGKNQTVVYNTFNSNYIECSLDNKYIQNLINEISMPNSGYCTMVTQDELSDKCFSDFIMEIRDSFSGDIVEIKDINTKPYIFKPQLRYLSRKINNAGKLQVKGEEILNNINEVSMYLTSSCEQSCPNCFDIYKQVPFCTKMNTNCDISIEIVKFILDRLKYCNVGVINFFGGNILKYRYLRELCYYLEDYDIKCKFFIYYKNITISIPEVLLNGGTKSVILIDSSFTHSDPLINESILNNKNIEFFFLIESMSDFYHYNKFKDQHNDTIVHFRPFFNNNNLLFFEDNIYMDILDIIERPISKKEIFRRQVLNELFFGKLTISPDGDVFSNVNFDPIGNIISDSLNEIVFREMNSTISWFKIRDEGACHDCCNKYLCPSPSNYELIIGKPNLCHVKPG